MKLKDFVPEKLKVRCALVRVNYGYQIASNSFEGLDDRAKDAFLYLLKMDERALEEFNSDNGLNITLESDILELNNINVRFPDEFDADGEDDGYTLRLIAGNSEFCVINEGMFKYSKIFSFEEEEIINFVSIGYITFKQ